MARVFLSHASRDGAVAETVRDWLAAAGHDTFLARDLDAGVAVGEDWQRQLHEKLRWADAVVLVVTSAYLASVWCNAEVAIAQSRGSRLLPIQAEPGILHPMLPSSLQYIPAGLDDETVRARLIAGLRRVASSPGWSDLQSPYPGLKPFDGDFSRVFFGRERECAELVEHLRSPARQVSGAALIIVGPSGSGKSSLARAGVLPAMENDEAWLTIPAILPGADAVRALARQIVVKARGLQLDWNTEQVHRRLLANGIGNICEELLFAAPSPQPSRLLIVVDQVEELLTQAGGEERAHFAELLRRLETAPVSVVGTLRSEYVDQILGDAHLRQINTDIYPLRPLGPEALRSIIERPAEFAGIAIEDGLVTQIVDDTEGGEALPLLAYTLAELAEGVHRNGTLERGRYEQLGGVQGTLARQADKALAAAMARERCSREDAIAVLLRLVTLDEQGTPTRWRRRSDELGKGAMWVLGEFVNRRLLVTDSAGGYTFVGVAHESFLTRWSPLADAIKEDAGGLRARHAVERAAAEWNSGGRRVAQLMLGARLAETLSAAGGGPRAKGPARPRTGLTVLAQEYLAVSVRRDRGRRGLLVMTLSVFLVVALALAGWAVIQQRAAESGRLLATARSLLSRADNVLAADPATAVRLGEAAVHTISSTETRAGLADLMLRADFTAAFDDDNVTVWGVAFASDRRTAAVAMSTGFVLRDVHDPAHPRNLAVVPSADGKAILAVAFDPDGRTLVVANSDNTMSLWDITDSAAPRPLGPPLVGQGGPVYSLAFTDNGTRLATLGGGSVIVWDVTDPRAARMLSRSATAPTDNQTALALTADGRTLATLDDEGVTLWDIADPRAPRPTAKDVTRSLGMATALALSPDGSVLVASGIARTALFDITDTARPRPIGQPWGDHGELVNAVAFTRSGTVIATASTDGTANVWDVTDRGRPRILHSFNAGISRNILAVAFSPDATMLATVGTRGTDLIWDLTGATRPRLIASIPAAQPPVLALAYSRDGRTLASAARDVVLSDVSDPKRPRPLGVRLSGLSDSITNLAFVGDGGDLALTGVGGGSLLWRATDGTSAPRFGPPDKATSVALAPDGSVAAMARTDGSVVMWKTADPADRQELGTPLGKGATISAMRFGPGGRVLAVATSRVVLLDLSDPAHPRPPSPPLRGHVNAVTAMAFSPDGHVLATGSADRDAILWDIRDVAAPRQLSDPLTGHVNTIAAIAFAPDGATFVTAGRDHTIIVWDFTDPTQPRPLGNPVTVSDSELSDVAFAPDGRTVAIAAADGTTSLWSLDGLNAVRVDPLDRACGSTVRGLNDAEWSRFVVDLPFATSCDQDLP